MKIGISNIPSNSNQPDPLQLAKSWQLMGRKISHTNKKQSAGFSLARLIMTVAIAALLCSGHALAQHNPDSPNALGFVGEAGQIAPKNNLHPFIQETHPLTEDAAQDISEKNEGLQEGARESYRSDGTLKYLGDLKNDQKEGFGIAYRADGTKEYSGEWKNDQKEGVGSAYRTDGTKEYSGDWKNGLKNGRGEMYRPDGITKEYFGDWKNDQKEGFGIAYRADGAKEYIGDWKNDQKQGLGKTFNVDQTVEYEGYWLHGEKTNFFWYYFIVPYPISPSHNIVRLNPILTSRIQRLFFAEEEENQTATN